MKNSSIPFRELVGRLFAVFSFKRDGIGSNDKIFDQVLRLDFTDVDHAVAKLLGCKKLSRHQLDTLADGYRHLMSPDDIVVLDFDDGRRDGGLHLTIHALWRDGYGAFDKENGIPSSWLEVCDLEFAGDQDSVVAA